MSKMSAITTLLLLIYFSIGFSKEISPRSVIDNEVETVEERWVTVTATENDIHATIGEMIELECEASGLGQPQMKFISSINDNNVFSYNVLGHSTTALVKTKARLRLLPEETQIINCQATSGRQIARDEIKISVSKSPYSTNNHWPYKNTFQPPRIVFFDLMYLDEMGNDAILPCRVESYGESKVTWLNAMKEIIDGALNDRYLVTSRGDLMIKGIQWNDMGAYTCVVSNQHGEDNITTFLYPMAAE